jgi:hypothetical protein
MSFSRAEKSFHDACRHLRSREVHVCGGHHELPQSVHIHVPERREDPRPLRIVRYDDGWIAWLSRHSFRPHSGSPPNLATKSHFSID